VNHFNDCSWWWWWCSESWKDWYIEGAVG